MIVPGSWLRVPGLVVGLVVVVVMMMMMMEENKLRMLMMKKKRGIDYPAPHLPVRPSSVSSSAASSDDPGL